MNEQMMQQMQNMDGGQLVVYIIIGTLLTWSIGLSIPLILRYLVFKKPIRMLSAVGIAFCVLIINFVVFRAMSGGVEPNPLPLMIMMWIIILILNKGYKKPGEIEEG